VNAEQKRFNRISPEIIAAAGASGARCFTLLTPPTADRCPLFDVHEFMAKGVKGVSEVYFVCMTRTNIELDDVACAAVMKRFNLKTKKEAVNFALSVLATEAMTVTEARKMRGSGWDGDLDEMRAGRIS
jgi:hypothetical protein